MKIFFTLSSKFSVVCAALLLLTASSFAQISLRKAVDMDGDGKADFTVFRPGNSVWYTLKSGGGFTAQPFGLPNDDYATPADFDGDGKGDIAVWRDTNGVWYWLNSSNNTFAAVQFGSTGDEPVARDYDGDGKTDQAVVRRTNGAMIWYVLRSTGGLSAAQFGLATDYSAPGDYDGDGKFDFAVQRPGTVTATNTNPPANFYIQQSRDGFQAVQFGLSNDLVVPGDYDGDGKTDIAVVREGATADTNLFWFILQSRDGFRAVSHGITGADLTVQNDYNGDGRTDVAVWRDSNGTFYILPSGQTNQLTAVQFGSASDFPTAAYDTH